MLSQMILSGRRQLALLPRTIVKTHKIAVQTQPQPTPAKAQVANSVTKSQMLLAKHAWLGKLASFSKIKQASTKEPC